MKLLRKPVSVLLSAVMILSLFTIIPPSVQAAEVCTDMLTVDDTGATRTNYVNWTAQSGENHPNIGSSAVYSGNSAKGNGGIQLRSKSQSGVVTTGSGRLVRKITVAWIDTYQNDDRNIAVYGKNTAYASAADLYNDAARGDLLDTFDYNDASFNEADGVYESVLEITDDYRFFGVRSKSGALYLSSVSVDWEISDAGREWSWAADYSAATCTFTDASGSHTEDATITSEVTKQPSYLEEGVLTHTATVVYNGVTYRDVQTEPVEKPVFGGSVPYIDENGEQMDSPAGTVLLTGDEGDLGGGWYTFAADTSVDDLTFNGNVKLVLCDGVTVASNGNFTVNGTLTVYAQTNSSGILAGTASGNNTVIGGSGSLIIDGGTYRWVGTGGYGCVEIHAGNLTVNGGSFTNCNLNAGSSLTVNGGTVNNDENTRISCPNGTVTVSGGDITLKANGSAVDCSRFVYSGGSFDAANALDGFVYSRDQSVTLSWTNESDCIHVGQYGCWQQFDSSTYSFDGFTMTLQKDFADQNGVKYPAGSYFSDDLRYKTLRPDVDSWNRLRQEIDDANSGDVIQLTSDCIASPSDSALVVPQEIDVLTIDLNGYTIDRGLADSDPVAYGNVITNHATELHIIDTSVQKTGRITGGNNIDDGGGIINDVDSLYLENVTVSGNKTQCSGGGIYSSANVILNNCEVTGNVAGSNGGGICYTGNNTNNRVFVSGRVIVTDNTGQDGAANNVFFFGSQNYIWLTGSGALTADSLIGVSTIVPEKTITNGLKGRGTADNFRSDSENWLVGAGGNGEAKLKRPYVIHFDANGGTGEMEDIVTLDSTVTMPECTFTAPEGKRFKAWSDGYGNNNIKEDEEVGLAAGIYEYTISAVWADVYTITVSGSTGGTIRANKQEAIQGERVRLTAVPDACRRLEAFGVTYGNDENVTVYDNSYFYMPAGNSTVTATWAPAHRMTHHPAAAPTYDADTDTYTNGNIEYWTCSLCGRYFSDENGETEITQAQTIVPYFTIHDNGTYVRVTKYNGTDAEVVIPDTVPDNYPIESLRGKKITSVNQSSFRDNNTITKVTMGDNIKHIGWEAFRRCSNLEEITIGSGLTTLDSSIFYDCPALNKVTCTATGGTISLTSYPFGNISGITFYGYHEGAFHNAVNKNSFKSSGQVKYVGIDAHTCSNPVWNWSGDYSSATAEFSCNKCDYNETIDATVTSETADGIITYTAAVAFDGATYTDTKTAFSDGVGARVIGHSISLDGDIAVNFYMTLDDSVKQSDTAYMQFTIPDAGQEYRNQTVYVKDLTPVEGGYYVFKCRVAAKDMTSTITAQIIDGDRKGTPYTYSVKDYADWLLEHKDDSEAYTKAAPLVEKMLRYGDYAANYFSGDDPLEALETEIPEGYGYYSENLPYGVTFDGATLSLKSQTTLSLYFTSEQALTLTCDSREFETANSGNQYVIRIRDIAAAELDQPITVKLNENHSVTYSPMTYCYKAQSSGNVMLVNAMKALYEYWQAAYEYFVVPEAKRIALTDNFDWGNAYLYAWGDGDVPYTGAFPGVLQAEKITNDYDETQFVFYVPQGATGIVFSNADGSQTMDITDFNNFDGYWMDGSQDGSGHYCAIGWNE